MIDRLKRLRIDPRKKDYDVEHGENALLPVDPRLPFDSEHHEQWTFEDDRIYLDGEDVETVVHAHQRDIGQLSSLSAGLESYARYVREVLKSEHPAFVGRVAGIQGKIMHRLGGMYQGMTSGIHVEWIDDRLWLNNIDVCALMEVYRRQPSGQAKAYLRGFYRKLALILANQNDSHGTHGVARELTRVFDELTAILVEPSPDDPPRLADTSAANA